MTDYKWRDLFVATNLTDHPVTPKPTPKVLSLGVGIDSTAMLLFLTNPARARKWLMERGRDPGLAGDFTITGSA